MSTRRRGRRPDRITVTKDLILFAVGLLLIVRQGVLISKDEFNWIVLAIGVGLTQAPGAMAMISILRTGGGSLEPPPDVPPLPPGSPSSSDSGGNAAV